MRVRLLSQSLGLSLGLRRSSRLGRAAGTHARAMHTLLGTSGGQGSGERFDCLGALPACESAADTDGTGIVWLWSAVGVALRWISVVLLEGPVWL